MFASGREEPPSGKEGGHRLRKRLEPLEFAQLDDR